MGTSRDAWRGFRGEKWRDRIDVDGFIRDNVEPYAGDAAFLSGATGRTTRIWRHLQRMIVAERERGIYDADAHTPSTITSHAPGWIDRDHELIVGLQTSAPLRRAIMPAGGLRTVQAGLAAHGYSLDTTVRAIFTQYRKTHHDGVFDAYPADVKAAADAHLLSGLSEVYGRGRVDGDYRRVALYGVDRLIEERTAQRTSLDSRRSFEDVVRGREELAEQIRALEDLRFMACRYGYDIAGPATGAREAIQWLYFAFLGAAKEQDGATLPLGPVSAFVDIYLQRDIAAGLLDETAAQELLDDFVIKLRIIRFLDAPAPDLADAELGGVVTRTSHRLAQSRRCFASSSGVSPSGGCANLAKALLYAINGGRDEMTGDQVVSSLSPVEVDVLDYDTVLAAYDTMLGRLAETYVDALNVINYMHDRYAYERLGMALRDHPLRRFMATGIAGLSVAVDSLSAIRYAQVKALRDSSGLVVDYQVDGDFPSVRDNDDRADAIAVDLVDRFTAKIRRQPTYRGAELTLSILTTGAPGGRHTGNTPDGRRAGEPL
ncbi:pyruvate formate lyase family protein [Paractinoplanes durhamensis]|uniref:PFL domain-containing protein n=1 Tax=Paractinoplanes durhamensis TaxID=113563 RepID=A0ABQ3Z3D4_9ACTN|nr:pyruvate formate lyase family protein [Actinoplanes durhamensis]GIE04348.1 hypothetical protein Adu01nite_56980 [Actinoplanes durhamensis]